MLAGGRPIAGGEALDQLVRNLAPRGLVGGASLRPDRAPWLSDRAAASGRSSATWGRSGSVRMSAMCRRTGERGRSRLRHPDKVTQRRCRLEINSHGSTRRACASRPKTVTLADTLPRSIEPLTKPRARNPRGHAPFGRLAHPTGLLHAACWASWLTTDSASSVSASSVAFSSSRVSSSSWSASLRPSSSAQVLSVP